VHLNGLCTKPYLTTREVIVYAIAECALTMMHAIFNYNDLYKINISIFISWKNKIIFSRTIDIGSLHSGAYAK
jgi:hypothetical protein